PVHAVAVQNERVYTIGLSSHHHLNIHDVSNPTQPAQLATVTNVGANPSHVFVDEPTVFITTNSGLTIIDVHGIQPEVIGDLDGDGHVDMQDLLILLSSWGSCLRSGDCPADFNDSGVVDVQDMLILLANWG